MTLKKCKYFDNHCPCSWPIKAKAVIAFDIHRLVQASHSLHTSSKSLAPVPALPEKGGQVRHGIIPEELFQLLYPKTGVTGMWVLEEWVSYS